MSLQINKGMNPVAAQGIMDKMNVAGQKFDKSVNNASEVAQVKIANAGKAAGEKIACFVNKSITCITSLVSKAIAAMVKYGPKAVVTALLMLGLTIGGIVLTPIAIALAILGNLTGVNLIAYHFLVAKKQTTQLRNEMQADREAFAKQIKEIKDALATSKNEQNRQTDYISLITKNMPEEVVQELNKEYLKLQITKLRPTSEEADEVTFDKSEIENFEIQQTILAAKEAKEAELASRF